MEWKDTSTYPIADIRKPILQDFTDKISRQYDETPQISLHEAGAIIMAQNKQGLWGISPGNFPLKMVKEPMKIKVWGPVLELDILKGTHFKAIKQRH